MRLVTCKKCGLEYKEGMDVQAPWHPLEDCLPRQLEQLKQENKKLRHILEATSNLLCCHHEMSFVKRAAERGFGDCELCRKPFEEFTTIFYAHNEVLKEKADDGK